MHRLGLNCFALVISGLGLSLTASHVRADIQPLPVDQSAYGMTRAELVQSWMEWFTSIPISLYSSPDKDPKGLRAGIGQHGPVWFLAPGPGGNYQTQTVVIPDGKAILAGVLVWATFDTPGADADDTIINATDATELLKQFTRMEASLDGATIPNLVQYRVQTPVFTITPPPGGNIYGETAIAGKDNRLAVAADAVTLLLPALPVGDHALSLFLEGTGGNGIGQTGKPFKFEIDWTLRVREPNAPLQ
jgi:hypothetical protein